MLAELDFWWLLSLPTAVDPEDPIMARAVNSLRS